MGNSLQDQLRKAGIVNEKKAKQVKDEIYRKKKQQKKQKAVEIDQNKLEVEQQRQEKIEKDKALNEKKLKLAREKEIVAQIYQLIDMNTMSVKGDIKYHFSYEKKVKSLLVNEKIKQDLSDGRLAIALNKESAFCIVPAAVADKIAQRDATFIISRHDKSTDVAEEDDPYADYQIPDDLMW